MRGGDSAMVYPLIRAVRVCAMMVAFLWPWLARAQARAQDEPVRIRLSFDVPFEDRPSAVCFVSKVQNKDSATVSELKHAAKDLASPNPHDWYVRAPVAPLTPAVERISSFLTPLVAPTPPDKSPQCAANACRATIAIPDDSTYDAFHLSCIANQQTPPTNRVVFVMLDYHREHAPTLSDPYLAGTTASLAINGQTERTIISVRSLGGNYLPGPDVIAGRDATRQELATIPLVPRCRATDVHLPRAGAEKITGASLRVYVDGEQLYSCGKQSVTNGQMLAVIPNGRENAIKTVILTVGTPDDDNFAQFAASWAGAIPPSSMLETRRTAVSFQWQRERLLRPSECPSASMPAAGIDCSVKKSPARQGDACTLRRQEEARALAPARQGDACTLRRREEALAEQSDACRYTCGALETDPTALSFDLPALLRFSTPGENGEVWADTLGAASEHLQSYVAPEDRTLLIDFRNWSALRPSNMVHTMVVEMQNGPPLRVASRGVQRVAIPKLEAGTSIAYHYEGERAFGSATLDTSQRETVAPDPAETVHELTPNAFLGGGQGIPLAHTGLSEIRSIRNWEFLSIGLGGAYRPWNSQWSYEFLLSYLLTYRTYYPTRLPGEELIGASVPFHRFGALGALAYRLNAYWVVGAYAGAYVSLPMFEPDFALAGGRLGTPIGLLFVRGRWTDWIWGELSAGMLFGDRYYQFITDFRGDPRVASGVASTFFWWLGLRFGHQ
jgi:hypothetical protein